MPASGRSVARSSAPARRKEAGTRPPRSRNAVELGEAHNWVLGLIAAGATLSESLDSLARMIERHTPGIRASILLLDDDGAHLRHGAAPSLPAEYCRAIDGLPIGPRAGSCGTAAFLKQRV